MSKKIAILALQGAFREHIIALEKLGIEAIEIRQKKDLNKKIIDGIIFPGGESTVMGKLLYELDLFEPIKKMLFNGLPAFGTCAGVVLIAKKILNEEKSYFGKMDITVQRNAYGRQLGSFHTEADFIGLGKVPMTFIRAPIIVETKKNVDILAKVNNHIVAARQDNMLVTTFHPELTEDLRIHKYFLDNFF